MDKKLFLIDKGMYSRELVENLTERELEQWASEAEYENDNSIIKIDGNGFDTIRETFDSVFGWETDIEDYYVFAFGYDEAGVKEKDKEEFIRY